MNVFVVEKPQRQTVTYTITEKNINTSDDFYNKNQILQETKFWVTIENNKIQEIEFKEEQMNDNFTNLSARYLTLLKALLVQLEKEGYALAYQTKEATQA